MLNVGDGGGGGGGGGDGGNEQAQVGRAPFRIFFPVHRLFYVLFCACDIKSFFFSLSFRRRWSWGSAGGFFFVELG